MTQVEEAKRRAALEAVSEVKSGCVVGLGSGSTVSYAIQALGKEFKEGLLNDIKGIPTSHQAAAVAREAGLPLTTLDEFPQVDVAIDGADQVDGALNLIKGGGAALMREKIVAAAAERYVIVVDEGKLTEILGEDQAVPLEVLPFAWAYVFKRLKERARAVELRIGSGKVGPIITDNGNFLVEADMGIIKNPRHTDTWLKSIPGVLETGLFLDMADIVYVGSEKKVRRLSR